MKNNSSLIITLSNIDADDKPMMIAMCLRESVRIIKY